MYFIKSYICMGKFKCSASSNVVPSIFMIHLVNGAEFLNAYWVTGAARTVMLPLTRM